MIRDSQELQNIIYAHYPSLKITDTAIKSGQRVVYFGIFADFERDEAEETVKYAWEQWGKVVLKISDGSSPTDVARMQNEIAALMGINSNYYPRLHHFELLSFNPNTEEALKPKLFVTIEEYIPSLPLSDCINNFNTEYKIVNLLFELLKALRVLWQHDKKYVHRDIKPANILIKNDGSIVVIDLGIIRESGSIGLTNTHLPIGPCTPGYASPEQLTNDKKNITFKSDLFSLGVLCYTLASGENPFVTEGSNLNDVFERTLNFEPPLLNQYQMYSDEFPSIIQKLMQKRPYKRYRDITNLINTLNALKEKLNDN